MTNIGITPSEKYLFKLSKSSFLSLWSYPNVYRSLNKEITDLLVICGKDIIIFQDKQSDFPDNKDIELNWKRWFKRTIEAGATQVWGAERIIKKNETKIYLDPKCEHELPIELPRGDNVRYHLLVITHGGSKACKEFHDGSGSFIIQSDLIGIDAQTKPFTVGDLDPNRSFIHILDDTSLKILMENLNTITDFSNYLTKKEKLLRSSTKIIATGEEELLANYLTNLNSNGEHDFYFGKGNPDLIAIPEGHWYDFTHNPQRKAQIEQDKISYSWDKLIEKFATNILNNTQYKVKDYNFTNKISEAEMPVRFMAMEPRFSRRILSLALMDMLKNTKKNFRMIRVMPSFLDPDVYFVFLLFPKPENVTFDNYRKVRAYYLEGTCRATKVKYPNAKHIIGIATETGIENIFRSEDALYLNATNWTPEDEKETIKFQKENSVLTNPTFGKFHADEYPDIKKDEKSLKNPRNKPCPCGSGKKFKKCCLNKSNTN